ncbi:MAG TPA: DUF5668 domain-containing protein [Candidatus Acidoferrales bacterium]|nr:DUF5668 domain-containing protein [Candidatus Acidoferrales bacterium]
MKCSTHPEQEATGYCRNCGKALCAQCTRLVHGALYCENCLASLVSHAPPATAPGAPNPALAAGLGFIPGLGAIYNGEYVKGLVHIAVFAGLIAILNNQSSDSLQAFFGIGLACFYLYMPIEAYRTARMKQLGGAAASYSPPLSGAAAATGGPVSASFAGPAAASFAGPAAASPAGPAATPPPYPQHYRQYRNPIVGAVVLIAVGVLFLMGNMGWLDADWLGRFWPVILIVIGVGLLVKRYRLRTGTGGPQS